jgi:preprotein translocase subunit SecG
MTAVLLIIHLIIALTLVGLVLLQRSEGGALGIGGGGGGGGGNLFSGRGAANILTRATAVLAAAFFGTSILLTVLAQQGTTPDSIFEGIEQPAGSGEGGGTVDENVLPQLPEMTLDPSEPQVPVSE